MALYLTSSEVAAVRTAADIIMETFDWCDTHQGPDFWGEVHDALSTLASRSDLLNVDTSRMTKAQLRDLIAGLRRRIEDA